MDISKMFGSNLESRDSNGVSEDTTSQSETDSVRFFFSFTQFSGTYFNIQDRICAILQSSSFNQEDLESMRGGRGLHASRMFNTRFPSISTSTSHPQYLTGSTGSILPQSSLDSYSHSYSASQPNLSRFQSPPPLKRKSRMLPLPSWWLSAKGDSLVSPLKPRRLFTNLDPNTPRHVDRLDLASTSSVRKKPVASTATIPPSFSLAGCLGTPEPRSRSGLLSFDRDCVLPGLFNLSIPSIRRPKPSLIPVRVQTCRISLGPVSLTGTSTQACSKWGKKKFVPSTSRVPVLSRTSASQAGPSTPAVFTQPAKMIRPNWSSLPILVDKNRKFPPELEVQAGPPTVTQDVRNNSIYSHHCAYSPPRRRPVLEKGKLPKRWH